MELPRRLRVFVSYRREDTEDVAARIADRVARWWNVGKVFIDVEALGTAAEWRKEISAALEKCDVLLAIIGPNWLLVGKNHNPRIKDPEDLLAFEIATALKRGIICRSRSSQQCETPHRRGPAAQRKATPKSECRDAHSQPLQSGH